MSDNSINMYRKQLLKEIANLPADDIFFDLMSKALKTVGESHEDRTRAFIYSCLQEPITHEMVSALGRLSASEQLIIGEAIVPLINYYGLGDPKDNMWRPNNIRSVRNTRNRRNRSNRSNRNAYKKPNRTLKNSRSNRNRRALKQYGGINLTQVLTMGIVLIGGLFVNVDAGRRGENMLLQRMRLLGYNAHIEPEMELSPLYSAFVYAVFISVAVAGGAFVIRAAQIGHQATINEYLIPVIRRVNQFLGRPVEEVPNPEEQQRLLRMLQERLREMQIGLPANAGENEVMAHYHRFQAARRRNARTAEQRAANVILRAPPTNAISVVSSRNNQDPLCVICMEALQPTEENPILIAVETTEGRAAGTVQDPVVCGHKYHENCIRGVLHQAEEEGTDSLCPSCRAKIFRLRLAHPEPSP